MLAELADALSKPLWRLTVGTFVARAISRGEFVVPPDSDALFERGLQLYRQRPDKEWSLTDCISFIVMSDESLTEALTDDHHFEQAGFVALFK